MRIAIQGEQGSFSHEAALRFGPELGLRATQPIGLSHCARSPQVFAQLASGLVEAAVIPIENSLAGSVLEHYDLLLAHPVRILAERLLRIRHCLIAAPGVQLEAVRQVYSHPVALAQCRGFFEQHPTLQAMPFYDTAGAAAHAVQHGSPLAAIASEHAALVHGGSILAHGIEDHPANYTRFLLLQPAGAPRPAPGAADGAGDGHGDKVSLAFAVPNLPGSLVKALSLFAHHGLDLSRIESRPVPGNPWEYIFYVDYRLGSAAHGHGTADLALSELATQCLFVKELGRYPAAED